MAAMGRFKADAGKDRNAEIDKQLRGSRGPKGADGLECDIEFDAPGIKLLQEGEPIVGHTHIWVPGNIDRKTMYCTCKAVGRREMTMDARVNERKDLTELEAKQRDLIAKDERRLCRGRALRRGWGLLAAYAMNAKRKFAALATQNQRSNATAICRSAHGAAGGIGSTRRTGESRRAKRMRRGNRLKKLTRDEIKTLIEECGGRPTMLHTGVGAGDTYQLAGYFKENAAFVIPVIIRRP